MSFLFENHSHKNFHILNIYFTSLSWKSVLAKIGTWDLWLKPPMLCTKWTIPDKPGRHIIHPEILSLWYLVWYMNQLYKINYSDLFCMYSVWIMCLPDLSVITHLVEHWWFRYRLLVQILAWTFFFHPTWKKYSLNYLCENTYPALFWSYITCILGLLLLIFFFLFVAFVLHVQNFLILLLTKLAKFFHLKLINNFNPPLLPHLNQE